LQPRRRIANNSARRLHPLAFLLLFFFSFIMAPVFHSAVRTQEKESDMYGLNAAQQPDGRGGFETAEYRKRSPGPLEEIIFYDH
jgi:STE24 endopeptidase